MGFVPRSPLIMNCVSPAPAVFDTLVKLNIGIQRDGMQGRQATAAARLPNSLVLARHRRCTAAIGVAAAGRRVRIIVHRLRRRASTAEPGVKSIVLAQGGPAGRPRRCGPVGRAQNAVGGRRRRRRGPVAQRRVGAVVMRHRGLSPKVTVSRRRCSDGRSAAGGFRV